MGTRNRGPTRNGHAYSGRGRASSSSRRTTATKKKRRFFAAYCGHFAKNCPKCGKDGHSVNTMRLDLSRFSIDNHGSITRRQGAADLINSDFECSYLSEKDVAEWVPVQHDACRKEWREGKELVATGEKLAANVQEIGWGVVASADVMNAKSTAAATDGAENRSNSDAILSAMENPEETAVGAAVAAATGGAAAILRAQVSDRRSGRGRDGSAARSGAVRGGASGAAAAAGEGRRPVDVDQAQPQSAS